TTLRLYTKSLSLPLVLRTLLTKGYASFNIVIYSTPSSLPHLHRFLQVTTKESEWIKLAELGFFDAFLLVFLTPFSLNEIYGEMDV
ncbi:hypothetical protein PFISCL1PPCAC_20914, partial [Pristionchus fissidentatus]